ncbi:MAG: hypothetical protein Q9M16_04945 [Mariprofundus sp.]|nr:hypothetical protein [Mariprofundus sp.]
MNNQDDRHFTLAANLGGTNMHLAIVDQDELNANLIAPLKDQPNVLRSSLDDNAGLLGAASSHSPRSLSDL